MGYKGGGEFLVRYVMANTNVIVSIHASGDMCQIKIIVKTTNANANNDEAITTIARQILSSRFIGLFVCSKLQTTVADSVSISTMWGTVGISI